MQKLYLEPKLRFQINPAGTVTYIYQEEKHIDRCKSVEAYRNGSDTVFTFKNHGRETTIKLSDEGFKAAQELHEALLNPVETLSTYWVKEYNPKTGESNE